MRSVIAILGILALTTLAAVEADWVDILFGESIESGETDETAKPLRPVAPIEPVRPVKPAAAVACASLTITTMQSESAFRKECLDAHNAYRAKHGAPPLVLSDSINDYAKEWAQHLARTNSFEHRETEYGENIFMADGQTVTGKTAVSSWYDDEVKKYNYNNPGFGMDTGHFTQVVWKDSKHLGVGVATSGDRTYVVANYDPAGNVEGCFTENVLRPKY